MTEQHRGIPEGASAVMPRLFCQDPAAQLEFCVAVFDAKDANEFWGDRTAWIMDPSGHVWTVATRVEETTEEERRARARH